MSLLLSLKFLFFSDFYFKKLNSIKFSLIFENVVIHIYFPEQNGFL